MGISIFSHAQFQYRIKLGVSATCQSDLLEITNNCDTRFVPTIGFIENINLLKVLHFKAV